MIARLPLTSCRVSAIAARRPSPVLMIAATATATPHACPEGGEKLVVRRHLAVPVRGETLQREGHIDTTVEREQWDQQHRRIQEHQIKRCIGRKRSGAAGFHAEAPLFSRCHSCTPPRSEAHGQRHRRHGDNSECSTQGRIVALAEH